MTASKFEQSGKWIPKTESLEKVDSRGKVIKKHSHLIKPKPKDRK